MIVVLHNIRSVYNVGSIFRTADAAGAEKIYLCGYTPAPIDRFGRPNQAFAKVALNAEKYILWQKVSSTTRLLDQLKRDKSYKIFAVEQVEGSVPYYKISAKYFSKSEIVIVMGNEIKGLSKAILKRADKILEIPMRGAIVQQVLHPRHTGHGKESLNVSVAFGIVAFHLAHINKK